MTARNTTSLEAGTAGTPGEVTTAKDQQYKQFDLLAAVAEANQKRQSNLQAAAAMQGVALHRLADGSWLASRWNLSRHLADDEVEVWLERVGGTV